MLKHMRDASFMEFEDSVKHLILLCEARQSLYKNMQHEMPPASFAQEFCTVKVDLGRQSGKTTLISKLASKDSIIVTFSERARNDMHNKCGVGYKVFTVEEIMATPSTLPSGRVFVDEAELVFRQSNIMSFYARLMLDGTRTFVLLG